MVLNSCQMCGNDIPLLPGLEKRYNGRKICYSRDCKRKRNSASSRKYYADFRDKKKRRAEAKKAKVQTRHYCVVDLVNAHGGDEIRRVIDGILRQ